MGKRNELNVFRGVGAWVYLQIKKQKEKIGFGLDMKKMKEMKNIREMSLGFNLVFP